MAKRRRPNIVLILADDLGWRDTSVYGSEFYETPNIERLARRGVVFTNAYAANPLCSPTRASILTGLWPARVGITAPVCHLEEVRLRETLEGKGRFDEKALTAISATRLRLEYFTLAESLKEAGYKTAHFGKWHLGREPYDPLHQGFDVDIPHWPGPGPVQGRYFGPWRTQWGTFGREGEHIEDWLSEQAVRFIRENRERPFFLNYWSFSVHSPWQAKRELVEKYRAKARRLKRSQQRHPLYAAMVETLDSAVGKILDAIDSLGLSRNTIIIFTSDNGGVHWAPSELRAEYGDTPITSNFPLRGGKATLYEGGTRVPFILVWPGVARPGGVCHEVVQSTDIFPTVLEMVGLKPKPGQKFDGVSIVPALKGERLQREAIFCHFPHSPQVPDSPGPGVYVRKGEWKLIRFFHQGPNFSHHYELYNLAEDVSERNNLAGKFPRKVKELDVLIEEFLRESGAVVPKPNPSYRPGALRVVDGWRASPHCWLSRGEGTLRVNSEGNDPFIWTDWVPEVAGEFTIRFRMRSESKGMGQFFWADVRKPEFGPHARLDFKPAHDGEWHEYQVKFRTEAPLALIRIDPSTAPGVVEFDWIRLFGPEGEVLKSWEF